MRQTTKSDTQKIARALGLALSDSVLADSMVKLTQQRARELTAAIAVLHPELGSHDLVNAFLDLAERRRAVLAGVGR